MRCCSTRVGDEHTSIGEADYQLPGGASLESSTRAVILTRAESS